MNIRLVKRVCKACRNKHMNGGWGESSDWLWNTYQEVGCMGIERGAYISILSIPIYCPYYMEHIVLQNVRIGNLRYKGRRRI